MKGVQCYVLFGGIALQNHEFFIDFMIEIQVRKGRAVRTWTK